MLFKVFTILYTLLCEYRTKGLEEISLTEISLEEISLTSVISFYKEISETYQAPHKFIQL